MSILDERKTDVCREVRADFRPLPRAGDVHGVKSNKAPPDSARRVSVVLWEQR